MDDIYSYLFTIVDKIEYQSLGCVCKQLNKLTIKNKSLLTYNSDALTCVVQDCHLTSYQTYVLRLLLSGVNDYCVPDVYNIRRIKAAYCSITGQNYIATDQEKQHTLQALEDYPLLLQSFNFETGSSTMALRLGYDSHRLYMDQQRYPVWVLPISVECINELPDGNVLRLSHNSSVTKHREETIIDPFEPIEKYSDFDIFVETSSKFLLTYSAFSILTQIRSKRPKLFVSSIGVIPTPTKYTEESLERLKLINATSNDIARRWKCMVANPTPGKLFICHHYITSGQEDLELVQAVINDFTGEDCFTCFLSFNECTMKQEMQLTIKKHTQNMWILIDPNAKLNDPLLTSVDTGMPRSQERIESTNLRKRLEKIIMSPTLRKGMMTKEEVFQECIKRRVHCRKTENRIVLVKRLLATL
jgi:hypothetical protein